MPQATAREPFEFSKEYIKERFLEHWELAEDFGEHFASALGAKPGSVFVDTRKLKFSVESTYQDIARYKDYHQKSPEKDRLDCTKRCSFFIKWLGKFKPISVSSNEITDDSLDYVELVNEAFSLYLFEQHLSEETGVEIVLSEVKARQFAYDLMYRQISVDGWIAILQLIKECVTEETGIRMPSFIELLEAA